MNRALARRTMFEQRADIEYFLGLVGEVVAKGWLEVHAFTVLTTHFHMLVRSPSGEMARALRHVQLEYARYFNRKRRRDGPLLRGRYLARLVASERYRRVLVGYIDANAPDAGLAPTAADFPFCSCHAYVTGGGPDWLAREWVHEVVCAATGAPAFESRLYAEVFHRGFTKGHRQLVEQRILRREDEGDPTDSLLEGAGPRVLDWFRRKAQLADGTRPGVAVVPIESIRQAMKGKQVRPSCRLLRQFPRTNWRAAITALLCRDLAGLTFREIGERLRRGNDNASELVKRARTALHQDPKFARDLQACAIQALEAAYGSGFGTKPTDASALTPRSNGK